MKTVLKSTLALAVLSASWLMLLAAPPPPARQTTLPAPRVNIDASVRAAIALANASRPAAQPAVEPSGVRKPRGCGCDRTCTCVLPGKCTCNSKARCSTACDCEKKVAAQAKLCSCGCGCTDCDCLTGGACRDPGCDCIPKQKKAFSLSAAIDKSVTYDRPLLIWVREVCPPCEAQMPEYIHVHVMEYQGAHDLVDYCAVIVGKPDGQGGMTRVATFSGIPSKEQVSEALNPKPRMVYLPPPPPMMFFGGNCGGGG